MQSDQAQRLEYLDFELQIGLGQGREYPVAVVRSPAGEPRETVRFPFDELALRDRLKSLEIALLRSGGRRRRIFSDEERAVQEFGKALFDAVFAGSVRDCYQVSLREAALQRKGLRIKLRIHAPELAALPWEFLYDSRLDEYICLSRKTPIIRYPELSQPIQPLVVTLPLRILGMIASPSDLPPLDVVRETQRLQAATEQLQASGLIDLTWLKGQTWRDLQRAMQGGPWHVFHFIGHGGFSREADEGIIALADDQGDAERLGAVRLGRLLADHDPLRLVLLNACEGARSSERDIFSSTAATLVRRGIPAVVAMQYEVSDEAAIEFTRAFYEAIAARLPIDAATVEARKAMSTAANSVEWGTPVLYMRAPDGVLFDWRGQARKDTHREEPQRTPASRPESPQKPPDTEQPRAMRTDRAEQEQRDKQLAQLYTQANSYYWTERWEQSIELFEQIIAQEPGYRDVASKLQRAREQQQLTKLYNDASQALETQSWDLAIGHLEALQKLAPGFRDSAARLAQARQQRELAGLYAEARQLYQARSWQAVINILQRIATLDVAYPDPDGLADSARAALAAEQLEQRLAGLYAQGLEAIDAGEWVRAHDQFQEIDRLKPGYEQTNELLARVSRELDEQAKQRELRELGQQLETALRSAIESDRIKQLRATVQSGRPSITPENAKQVALQRVLKGHTKQVNGVAFSPDGQTLASCSGGFFGGDKAIKLWRVAEGTLLHTLTEHTDTVRSVSFAPDGQLLASGSDDNTIRLWRASTGEHGRTVTGHSNCVYDVALAPDGQTLASASADTTIRMWHVSDGEHMRTLTGHSSYVKSVAFAPDGQMLASASTDKTIRLWRASDGEHVRTLTGHSGTVAGVAFAPDGQMLASASADTTIRLWRASDGAHVRTLSDHTASVNSIAFAPDGQMLASASYDNTIRLWRVADGMMMHVLTGHGNWVETVAFSPDGALLASGSHDQTVRIWAVQSEGTAQKAAPPATAADKKMCPTCEFQMPRAAAFCPNCGARV